MHRWHNNQSGVGMNYIWISMQLQELLEVKYLDPSFVRCERHHRREPSTTRASAPLGCPVVPISDLSPPSHTPSVCQDLVFKCVRMTIIKERKTEKLCTGKCPRGATLEES